MIFRQNIFLQEDLGRKKVCIINRLFSTVFDSRVSKRGEPKTSMMSPVWPVKSRQMSIKVAQKWFHKKYESFLSLYKKLYKNISNLGKIIVATGFEKLPKVH